MKARSHGLSILVAAALLATCLGAAPADAGLGAGVHYLRNLGDISDDEDIDLSQDSFSLIASFKSRAGMLNLDGQVEYIFDHIGTGNEMWQPSLWALLGQTIYGGAGVGIGYTDGDWQRNPFYALRAGVELPLGGLALDGYGTYRFQHNQELSDLTGEDLDSVTFALLLRFGGR
jgi:hypothetical protein